MGNKNKKWQEFEKLVKRIQKELSPDADVVHDTKLWGFDSRTERQIDVLVQQKLGHYPIKIVIECRYRSRKIDLPKIEGFVQKLKDVRANKGVMVSSKGFSKPALELAKKHDIDTYTVVDAENANWSTYVGVPAVAQYVSVSQVYFKLTGSPQLGVIDLSDLLSVEVFNLRHDRLGNLVDVFVDAWNQMQLPFSPGPHVDKPMTPTEPIRIKSGNEYIEAKIYATYDVEEETFFGSMPIINAQGFWDLQKEALVFSSDQELITDWVDRTKLRENWEQIDDIDSAPKPPMVIIKNISHYFSDHPTSKDKD